MMNPFAYLIAGSVGGGIMVAICFWFSRRREMSSEIVLRKIELLESSQERGERILRDELSRSREENANAAKSQREELSKSFESVRTIVDERLRQLQEDNGRQIDKMRATVDEK